MKHRDFIVLDELYPDDKPFYQQRAELLAWLEKYFPLVKQLEVTP